MRFISNHMIGLEWVDGPVSYSMDWNQFTASVMKVKIITVMCRRLLFTGQREVWVSLVREVRVSRQ